MYTDRILSRTLIVAAVIHLVFAIGPGIDLWFSARFYDGTRFPLQTTASGQSLRLVLWHVSMLVPLSLLVACGAALLAGRSGARDSAIRVALQLGFLIVGPGLVVNELLKSYWGRARPQDVIEFGGLAPFTPPFELAGACLRNCSFVSGEVAMAVAAALVAFHLAAPAMTRRSAAVLACGLVLFCLTSAYLRVAMGRHFLSDAVFAALLMLVLHRVTLVLTPRAARNSPLILTAVLDDCRVAWGMGANAVGGVARMMTDRWSFLDRPLEVAATKMQIARQNRNRISDGD